MLKALIVLVSAVVAVVRCGVSGDERCSEGRIWVPEYTGCVDPAAGSGGAANQAGSTGSMSEAGSGGNETGSGGGSNRADNLGNACTSDPDCAGVATKCLLNPLAPADPGICTISNCTSETCGEDFDCCDCAASPLVSGMFPKPVCIAASQTAQLTALSCSCN